jgi:hypothetical protein
LVFSSLDNREPEKVPGTIKKELRSREEVSGDGKKCQSKASMIRKKRGISNAESRMGIGEYFLG